jgi:nitric oxide reductase large subunit
MIQIIGLLLCVYLVFKGIEIFQIAISSPVENNSPRILGTIALIAAIGIAALFAFLLLASGASMPTTPSLP